MEGKRVRDSAIIMSQVMTALDANLAGNVHGGVIMKLIDTAAGVVASRHTRRNAVTASVDRIDFHSPIHVGDLVIIKASLNMVGRSSMEVGVRVEAEKFYGGELTHTVSAYLTMVALDENGKPVPVPPLILETAEEQRRHREAQARRAIRLSEKRNEG